MKALILAGGYGTRLYPLTLDRPKPLLLVGSRTITDRLLEKVEGVAGIDEVYVVTNGKFAGRFEEWAGNCRYNKPIRIINDRTFTNETRLGAIGDIELVIRKAEIKDDLLILGGDNLFEFALSDLIRFAGERRDGSVVALRDIGDIKEAKKYGIVTLDANGRITEFVEKPARPQSTLAAMCIYLFPKEKLELLKAYLKTGRSKDAPGHYIGWLAENDTVYGYKIEGEWFDIGDKRLLELADEIFTKKEGERKDGQKR